MPATRGVPRTSQGTQPPRRATQEGRVRLQGRSGVHCSRECASHLPGHPVFVVPALMEVDQLLITGRRERSSRGSEV